MNKPAATPLHYENTADVGMPKTTGWYRVIVQGDSEAIDGHTIYSFDDYSTWMLITVDDEDGAYGTGIHDEMIEYVVAWFGPIELPKERGQ